MRGKNEKFFGHQEREIELSLFRVQTCFSAHLRHHHFTTSFFHPQHVFASTTSNVSAVFRQRFPFRRRWSHGHRRPDLLHLLFPRSFSGRRGDVVLVETDQTDAERVAIFRRQVFRRQFPMICQIRRNKMISLWVPNSGPNRPSIDQPPHDCVLSFIPSLTHLKICSPREKSLTHLTIRTIP